MSNYLDEVGTLIEGFETVGDWTLSGAGGLIAADTVNFKENTQGIKVTSVNNVSATITKTISKSFALVDRFSIWVYIDDISLYSQVSTSLLILSSTADFSKIFTVSISVGNAMSNGWNKLMFLKSDFAAVGGEDWANTMIRLRFRVLSAANSTVNVTLDDLRYGEYARPKCIISFDDGADGVYNEGYPYMRTKGFRGVVYEPEGAVRTVAAGYMTLAQLTEMYNYGWDICNHSLTHPSNMTVLTQAEAETEISGQESWLVANNFIRNNMQKHFAIPSSTYNSTTLAALAAQRVATSRSGIDAIQQPFVQDNLLLKRGTITSTTTLATVKGYIDNAIAKGGVIIFNFHQLITTPTQSTEWAIADFKALMDYLYVKSPQIDVVTISEWYLGLGAGRRKFTEFAPV